MEKEAVVAKGSSSSALLTMDPDKKFTDKAIKQMSSKIRKVSIEEMVTQYSYKPPNDPTTYVFANHENTLQTFDENWIFFNVRYIFESRMINFLYKACVVVLFSLNIVVFLGRLGLEYNFVAPMTFFFSILALCSYFLRSIILVLIVKLRSSYFILDLILNLVMTILICFVFPSKGDIFIGLSFFNFFLCSLCKRSSLKKTLIGDTMFTFMRCTWSLFLFFGLLNNLFPRSKRTLLQRGNVVFDMRGVLGALCIVHCCMNISTYAAPEYEMKDLTLDQAKMIKDRDIKFDQLRSKGKRVSVFIPRKKTKARRRKSTRVTPPGIGIESLESNVKSIMNNNNDILKELGPWMCLPRNVLIDRDAVLGKGQFGDVFKCVFNGEDYAVKVLKGPMNTENMKEFIKGNNF